MQTKAKLLRWRKYFPSGRLFNIHNIHRHYAQSGHTPVLHGHDFAEVFWISHGRCAHWVNGTEQIMHAGELCLIRPRRDAHSLRKLSGALTFFNVAFPKSILSDLCRRYPAVTSLWFPATNQPMIIHLTEAEHQWIDGAAGELLNAAQDRMLLDRFLLGLTCSIHRKHADPWRACPAWMQEAVGEMRQTENMATGIPAFLKLCRRSPAHVARILKKHTGLTPSEVVNQTRLEYAAARLKNTADDIQVIALDCGFNSLSYFYRLFHRHYGAPPRRYRHDHRTIPAMVSMA